MSAARTRSMPWPAPPSTASARCMWSATTQGWLAALGSPVGVSVLCPGFVRTRIGAADRNWPASYGPLPPAQEPLGREDVRQAVSAAIENGLDPAVIADAVSAAIVDGRFWILTHPELNDAVLGRYSDAVQGRNPQSA